MTSSMGNSASAGASALSVGTRLDGILLHNAFHYAHDGACPVVLTIFPMSFIESASAFPGNPPLEFSGAGAAAVAFTSREERTAGPTFEGVVSPMEVMGTAEGTLPNGSWLVGLRDNLSGYIVRRLGLAAPVAFHAADADLKTSFHPDPFDIVSAT